MKSVLLFLAYHALCMFVVMLPLGAGLSWLLGRRLSGALVGAAASVLALLVGLGTLFLFDGAPHDAVAENVLLTATQPLQGHPLYLALAAGDPRGLCYGPLLFEGYSAWMALVGDSLPLIRLPGVLASWASAAGTGVLVGRRHGARAGLLAAGAVASVLLSFGPYAFAARPEVFNTLLVVVALGLILKAPPRVAHLGGGLVLGFLVGIKPHAALYVLPLLAWVVARDGPRAFALGIPGALVAVVAPWLLPAASLESYLAWLGLAARHGIEAWFLSEAAEWLALYGIALACAARPQEDADATPRPERIAILTLGVVALILLVPAGKAGAGRHHFLPLVPLVAFLAAERIGRRGLRKGAGPALLALVATLAASVALGSWTLIKPSIRGPAPAAVRADLAEVMADVTLRPIEIGFGESAEGARLASYRLPLVLAGQPYSVNEVSLADWHRGGRPFPAALQERLIDGPPEVWLIPKGERPFTLTSGYRPHPQLFPPAFQDQFAKSFELARSSQFFDVYTRREASPGDTKKTDSAPRGE